MELKYIHLHQLIICWISLKKEVLNLIQSGCYDIVQQINDGPEEPYEGCEHNLYMILEDPEPTVTVRSVK